MGFMGMESYLESDMAADLMYVAVKKQLKAVMPMLEKEMKRDNGGFNTPGHVNVAWYIINAIPQNEAQNFYEDDKKFRRMVNWCLKCLFFDSPKKGRNSEFEEYHIGCRMIWEQLREHCIGGFK